MINPILPTIEELRPQLDRLEANPGSVILLAIEQPEVCNFGRCTVAWLSWEERKTLRTALENARKKREQSHDVGAGRPRRRSKVSLVDRAASDHLSGRQNLFDSS